MNDEEKDPQSLVELTANLMSHKFITALEKDIAANWVDIANGISSDPVTARKFFSKKTIKLAQIYVSSMNLFVDMDENSDIISGVAEEDNIDEPEKRTRFDFDSDSSEDEE